MPKYFPEPPPEPKLPEFRALGEYVFRELNRISQSIFTDVYLNLEETFVASDKPQNGDVVFADGTSWNPGNGRGIYAYIGGTWVKLGIGIGDDLTLDDLFVDDIVADDISANDITFTGNLIGSFNVPENLIVNGAMQHSQQNGVTASGADSYYPADEWPVFRSTSAGVISSQWVASITPKGNINRIRVSVTTADVSLAATEYLMVRHPIEGYKVQQLQWGTASAKALIVRFGFKGPAGTYAVSAGNSAQDRSYVREFTISAGQANTDTEQTLIFPGDTSGTWLKDNGLGIYLRFTVATGSTYHISPDTWTASLGIGTSSTSNGLGVNTNVFEFFDIDAYIDIYGTGIAPPYQIPDWTEELMRCRRYWSQNGMTFVVNSPPYNNTAFYKVPMRVNPTLAVHAGGVNGATYGGLVHDGTGGFRQITAASAAIDAGISANARL